MPLSVDSLSHVWQTIRFLESAQLKNLKFPAWRLKEADLASLGMRWDLLLQA